MGRGYGQVNPLMRNRDSCGAGQVVEGAKGELEHFEGEVRRVRRV